MAEISIFEQFYNACKDQNSESVGSLISTGAIDIDAANLEGNTPLHVAVFLKSHEIVDYLLTSGANVDGLDSWGATPLVKAIVTIQRKMVGILLSHGAKLTGLGKSGNGGALETILRFQLRDSLQNQENELQRLHECNLITEMILARGMESQNKTEEDYFVLCDAIVKDDLEAARSLIKDIEDINFRGVKAGSPLAMAILLSRLKIAELLLQNKADPNQDHNCNRESVLYEAINSKCLKMVQLLLEYGVDVNVLPLSCIAEGNPQWTPLHFAVRLADHQFRDKLIRLLLDNGAKFFE